MIIFLIVAAAAIFCFLCFVGLINISIRGWVIMYDGESYYLSRKQFLGFRQWATKGSFTSPIKADARAFTSYESAREELKEIQDYEFELKRQKARKMIICDGSNHIQKLNRWEDYEKLTRSELLDLVKRIRQEVPIGNLSVEENLPGRISDLVTDNARMAGELEPWQ